MGTISSGFCGIVSRPLQHNSTFSARGWSMSKSTGRKAANHSVRAAHKLALVGPLASPAGGGPSRQTFGFSMPVTPTLIRSLVEAELEDLHDERVRSHIQSLLVEPAILLRDWDYGAPGQTYPLLVGLESHRVQIQELPTCEGGEGVWGVWSPKFPGVVVTLSGVRGRENEKEKKRLYPMSSGNGFRGWFLGRPFLEAYLR